MREPVIQLSEDQLSDLFWDEHDRRIEEAEWRDRQLDHAPVYESPWVWA